MFFCAFLRGSAPTAAKNRTNISSHVYPVGEPWYLRCGEHSCEYSNATTPSLCLTFSNHCSHSIVRLKVDFRLLRLPLYFDFIAGPGVSSNHTLPDMLTVGVSGEYEAVTVLFCDVVSFSQIVTRCRANDVVNLLTQLHVKFDRVCKVHETFRVSNQQIPSTITTKSNCNQLYCLLY